ncbi:hypothetical protein OG874_07870 [Nocardia sp. NBC_00565]|uniref:hypothetical protein n=1 Tax=Nocardia sp. NBC_00565 TaxID=2975993 RepID=UPI002E822847|nr:hypothetical protein [Nocardia sp. NBC_00565]WUC05058.1 hypothetical protein OG874_07870 [Nocardia sp. NBC_00565]
MTEPKHSVQLLKLARTLGVPVDQLAYLTEVPDQDLREFRHRNTAARWMSSPTPQSKQSAPPPKNSLPHSASAH